MKIGLSFFACSLVYFGSQASHADSGLDYNSKGFQLALSCAAITVYVDGLSSDSEGLDGKLTNVSEYFVEFIRLAGREAVEMLMGGMENLNNSIEAKELTYSELLGSYGVCVILQEKAIPPVAPRRDEATSFAADSSDTILLFCENQEAEYSKEVYFVLDLEAGTLISTNELEDEETAQIDRVKKIDEYKIHFDFYIGGRHLPHNYAELDRRSLVLKKGRTSSHPDGAVESTWKCEIASEKKI